MTEVSVDDYLNWREKDLEKWLGSQGVQQKAIKTFMAQELAMDQLNLVTERRLLMWGISPPHSSKLLHAIQVLAFPFVNWSETMVEKWAQNMIGIPSKHAAHLSSQEVNGRCLLTLEEDHLLQWGIPGGFALKLMKAIQELKNPSPAPLLPTSSLLPIKEPSFLHETISRERDAPKEKTHRAEKTSRRASQARPKKTQVATPSASTNVGLSGLQASTYDPYSRSVEDPPAVAKFAITLPDGTQKSVLYNETTVLSSLVQKLCDARGYNAADIIVVDEFNMELDVSKTLSQVGRMKVKLIQKEGTKDLPPLPIEVQEIVHQITFVQPMLKAMIGLSNRPFPLWKTEVESFMTKQRQEKKLSFLDIPWSIRSLSDQIIMRGLRVEGIGRVPGSSHVIHSLIETIDKGDPIDFFDEELGGEEMMDIWKRYFRSLPSPLLHDDALQCLTSSENDAERIAFIKGQIKSRPKGGQALLKELFYLMHCVSLVSHLNKMTVENLGTVIGMSEFLVHAGDQQTRSALSEFLISNYEAVFFDLETFAPVATTTPSLVVYCGDGNVRTMGFSAEQDTLKVCRVSLEKKTDKQAEDSWSNWHFYLVCGRKIRRLEEQEHLLPLANTGAVLYFTNHSFPGSPSGHPDSNSLPEQSEDP